MTLTERIRQEARRLGFFRIGVVEARELPWGAHFDAWLARSMHAEMTWLERQAGKRRNPDLVLPGVRTLLLAAMNYYSEINAPSVGLRGRISRYALGRDYHRLMDDRLRALLAFIEGEIPGVRGIRYADAGPVMEKAWGAASSLGWLGKHGNLITRANGSWFFIGTILLDAVLEFDSPAPALCGSCTRCLEACPTGAIVSPYVVDARLCISYLTIELRGAIPRCLRPLIGNRIFGCDDCQEVCPWNRFAVATSEEFLLPADADPLPELAPLVSITVEAFNDRFRQSPMRRARRDGFVRNVVVALGNTRRAEAVAPLAGALLDASALVRGHAAWALGRIDHDDAMTSLLRAQETETDPDVRDEITSALKEQFNLY